MSDAPAPAIHRFPDPAALAAGAADWIADTLGRAIAARGHAAIALAGGSTPRALHVQLAARAIDWSRVTVWFGDERCVPPDDANSNYQMARASLLDRLPVAPAAVHRIEGELAPAEAAARYHALLATAPPFDVIVLGMGDDGHVASWFPDTPPFAADALAASTHSPKPPPDRVTMTPRALGAAGAIVVVVSGAAKAARLAEVWAEVASRRPRLPAAQVSARGDVHWFVDDAAASALPETVPVAAPESESESEPESEPVLEETPVTETTYQVGVLGVGVMGRNLAWNIADHGYTVAVWNREADMLAEVLAAAPGRLHGTSTLPEFVAALERPRRILIMITAGKPVDYVLDALEPLLEPGDIVIDGGNSWFEDTRRREDRLTARGLNFFGVGISGGEDGARHGPSMMPGGKADAYLRIQPVLEAIAARTDSGPCVTHVGADGAGHFVKMVHNGIEYADMQFIAEAYDVLRRVGGLEPPALAATFKAWNQGALESFLIEITAQVFTTVDPRTGGWLVDHVLDQAGQKGTGKWTAQVALDLGVAIPSIAAAIDARNLSSLKPARVLASAILKGPAAPPPVADADGLARDVHDALYAAKLCAYAQGMALIRAGSDKYNWGISLEEMARIWKGGCIIRARLLDTIMHAFRAAPALSNLLLDPGIAEQVNAGQAAWRRVVGLAQAHGIPVPAMAAGLAYFDSYRTASLPQNLTQAQRDAFGAHTYQRSDAPDEGFVHTDWLP